LGFTFKENCPDVRNTKVVDIIKELETYHTNITILDPWAEPKEVKHEYGLDTIQEIETIKNQKFDAVILAVAHNEFKTLDLSKLKTENGIVFDVKGFYSKEEVDARL
jgi:UDP-N-acetyl-D-galactosamine dehydrogenase